MNVTLRQLKVFAAVARNLSFTQAAKELHLTQPAVSMQVAQLEEDAGLALFDKIGKRIQLTEAGAEMYHYSHSIHRQIREITETMEALKGVQKGHLRISVASTAESFATRLLAAFTQQYPGTGFALDITNRKSLLEQLQSYNADLVIMGRPPENSAWVAKAFMPNPLVIIAAPTHPLAQSKEILSLAQLRDEVFVTREKDSGTRLAMERFFLDQGMKVRAGMEMTSNSAIKHSVAAGLGLGLVSYHTLELELEAGRLSILKVEGFPIRRHWYVVHNQHRRLPPIAKAFLDFLGCDQAAHLLQFRYPKQY